METYKAVISRGVDKETCLICVEFPEDCPIEGRHQAAYMVLNDLEVPDEKVIFFRWSTPSLLTIVAPLDKDVAESIEASQALMSHRSEVISKFKLTEEEQEKIESVVDDLWEFACQSEAIYAILQEVMRARDPKRFDRAQEIESRDGPPMTHEEIVYLGKYYDYEDVVLSEIFGAFI